MHNHHHALKACRTLGISMIALAIALTATLAQARPTVPMKVKSLAHTLVPNLQLKKASAASTSHQQPWTLSLRQAPPALKVKSGPVKAFEPHSPARYNLFKSALLEVAKEPLVASVLQRGGAVPLAKGIKMRVGRSGFEGQHDALFNTLDLHNLDYGPLKQLTTKEDIKQYVRAEAKATIKIMNRDLKETRAVFRGLEKALKHEAVRKAWQANLPLKAAFLDSKADVIVQGELLYVLPKESLPGGGRGGLHATYVTSGDKLVKWAKQQGIRDPSFRRYFAPTFNSELKQAAALPDSLPITRLHSGKLDSNAVATSIISSAKQALTAHR